MKKGTFVKTYFSTHILLAFIATMLTFSGFAATFTSTGGNWNAAGDWSSVPATAGIPGPGDDVIINSNMSIPITTATCRNLTINSGFTLTLNGSQKLTVNGNWTNNGTWNPQCCGGSSFVVMKGSGATIGGSSTSMFITLEIDPGAGNTISLANSNMTIRNGGNLVLTSGFLSIGAANSFGMAEDQSASITVTNGNLSGGGTINANQKSGGYFNVDASSTNILQLPNIKSTGDGNWKLNIVNASSARINGTLTVNGSQSNGWLVEGHSPIWGPASTFFIDKQNQAYSAGLEWSANSGTIGVTPGYMNNFTFLSTGSSTDDGAASFNNVAWTPTGAIGLNGIFQLGDGTKQAMVSLYKVTSFNSGGIIVDNNSRLVTPPANVDFIDRGDFILRGATIGVIDNAGATIDFRGPSGGTQVISTTGTSITFSNMTVSGAGTNVQLQDPVNINGVLTMTAGNITNSAVNALTLSSTASTVGGSSTSYVDGPMKWTLPASGAGPYKFPVGNGGAYLPISLSSISSTAGTTVTATPYNTNSGGWADGTTVTSISNTEYWSLAATNAISAAVSVGRGSGIGSNNSLAANYVAPNRMYSSIGGTPSGSTISGGNISIPGGGSGFITMVVAPLDVTRVGGKNAALNPAACPSYVANSGSLVVSGTGGTPGYRYSIDGGPYTPVAPALTTIPVVFDNLSVGSHIVRVQDATGSTPVARTLYVLGAVSINGNNQNITYCNNTTPVGSATLTAINSLNPSPTYTWTSSPVSTLPSTSSITVSPSTATTYTVTSTATSDGSNLITNGGFESGLPGGTTSTVTTATTANYTLYTAAVASSFSPNPGFPYNTTPGSGGYYVISNSGGALCNFFWATTAQEGTRYFVADGSTGSSNVLTMTLGNLKTTSTYKFTFYYAEGNSDGVYAVLNTSVTGGTISGGNINVNSTAWNQATYTITPSATTVTITIRNNTNTGNTNGNDFYLDNFALAENLSCTVTASVTVSPASCPLPVSYTDFNIVRQGQGALVTWGTAMERNSSYYIIEKSTDGKNFSPIGRVEAAGNSTGLNRYTFTDPSITSGITYYQLAQYDLDGSVHYSEVKAVSKEGLSGVIVSPNPNNGVFTITILDTSGKTESRVIIVNSLGQVVYEDGESTSNLRNVDISYLANGMYYLQVITDEETITQKMLKN